MTVTVDINVLLDVFQNRRPYYAASAHAVSMVQAGTIIGICPAHGLTTLYYIARKLGTKQGAESLMDRILDHFQIGNLDMPGWREARALPMDDFEDAAVATTARATGSEFILTRDVDGFKGSPIPAISPEDFIMKVRSQP